MGQAARWGSMAKALGLLSKSGLDCLSEGALRAS